MNKDNLIIISIDKYIDHYAYNYNKLHLDLHGNRWPMCIKTESQTIYISTNTNIFYSNQIGYFQIMWIMHRPTTHNSLLT
jgi:hypothetical protein